MEYEGKLYGKVGGEYFQMIETTEDINRYKQRIKELEQQVSNTDLLHDVSKRFDSEIERLTKALRVTGFDNYRDMRKAEDELRCLEVSKKLLNVC